LVTHERRPLFASEANVRRWRSAVAKVQRQRPFVIEAEVILLDHLHLLWSLPLSDGDYATRIRLIKTHFTKSLGPADLAATGSESRLNKGERDIWQRRYWEHQIRDEQDWQVKLDYIHYNPVRHRLAVRPADWPNSTFHTWVEKGMYDPWWGSDDEPPLPPWAEWD
jgi:putative transposase